MPTPSDEGIKTPVPPSAFARLATAARYAITGVAPTTWFGPQQPLAPMAPPEVKGRQFDYSNYEGGFQKIYWDEIKDFRSGIAYEIRQGSTWATALPIRTQAHPPFIAQGNGQLWVSAKCTPITGLTVDSSAAQSITVSGNQLSINLVRSWDEQATGWSGAFDAGLGTDGVGVNKFLRLGGAQNILTTAPFLESLAASAATAAGAVLHFSGGVPAGIAKGMSVANKTHPSVIPGAALVQSTTSTTVTLNV